MSENIFFILSHPIDALRAISLKGEAKILDDIAPTNYLGISLTDAIRGIQKNRVDKKLDVWPKSVRTDIAKGEVIYPDGRHPEHPNV